MTADRVRVTVVGLGAMGQQIAGRLLDAGYDLQLWNRTPAKADALVAHGAALVPTPAAAARGADVVITMVADPAALRDVTEGPDGIAAGAGPKTTLIEMSTVGPAAVARLSSTLPPTTPLLDAPVLGSLAEAANGTLTIFVGGEDEVVERWTPLLTTLGSPIHVGPLGAGAAAKLVANSALFAVIVALGEALALADALGLERETAYDVLATTPLAAQAERRRQSIESSDYPPRFKLTLARKDAALIAEAAKASGLDLRLAEAARTWLVDADRSGFGDHDYAAVLAHILTRRKKSPELESDSLVRRAAGRPRRGNRRQRDGRRRRPARTAVSWPGLSQRLEGRLVVLEPTGAEHQEPLWEAAQDPAVWSLMPIEAGASRDLFDRWWAHLRGAADVGAEVPFTTVDRGSGRVLGGTRYVALRPDHRGLEIGHTWLRSGGWGTGANVEAKLLMLEHAFERMGCMRVELKTDARNERSRRAMEALPARFEGISRKHMLVRDGEIRDSAWYAITDDEWSEVRANLGRRLAAKIVDG